jgi:DNA-binding transcriptional ArsR family regulator
MDVFAILAEPVRYRIVEILATGEHSSGQLADVLHHEFGVGWPAVSQHLRMLRGSGFVVRRSEGPSRVYRLDPTALEQLDRRVERLHKFWNARYGWPYRADPLSPHLLTTSRRPNRGRGQRGRSERPIVFEVTEDNDLWQWIGD